MLPDDNLWTRIEQFELDEPDAGFPFSARLAREVGWTYPHTQRVIEEYKRFLYLACAAGHPVSPSEAVDEVWHLHLTYSQSYWEVLCPQVLRQSLHHQPTQGGREESAKFQDWYRRTLESYERFFGQPPEDIWPRAEKPKAAKREVKVDMERNWVIPKPQWWPLRFQRPERPVSQWLLPFAVLLVAILGGCGSGGGALGPWDLSGPTFLALYWGLCAVAIPTGLWWRSTHRFPDDDKFPAQPLEPLELARLVSHKPEAIAQTAIAGLLDQGAVQITGPGRLEVPPGTERPKGAKEAAFWDLIRTGQGTQNPLLRLAGQYADTIDAQLRTQGLILSYNERFNANGIPQLVHALLLFFGVVKIFIGLSRNRPVDYLVITCLALFIWMLVFEFGLKNQRTGRGERYLQHLMARRRYAPPVGESSEVVFAGLAMAVALYGAGELPYEVRPLLRPPASTSDGGSSCGSDSGGSSCSSGGDSGGSSCGSSGCGGCGGGGGGD